jgi:Zn-dependent protease
MLLTYLDLLRLDPAAWLWLMAAGVAGIVSAVTVHEAGHAWAALQLGDRTAHSMGRVSLDPRRHLDPLGSLLFLLGGFGWGKPTPVEPGNLRGERRAAMGLVSVAGPASNLLTAFLLSLPVRAGAIEWTSPFGAFGAPGSASVLFGDLVSYAIYFNVILAIFNLLPLVPLDGFRAAAAALPRAWAGQFERLERLGPTPLFLLLLVDVLTPLSLISSWLVPVADFAGRVVAGHPIF